MKVLFIHNKYQHAGGEDVAVELETALLAHKGHEVRTLFFSNDEARGLAGKIKLGINSVYNAGSATKVKAAIRDFKPEVIHVHNWFFAASPAILYAAAKEKVPVVMTLHNYRLVCANALLLRNNLPCELCVPETFPLHGIRYKCYRQSASQSAIVTTITGIHKLINTWQKKVDTFILLTAFAGARFAASAMKVDFEKFIIKPNFIPDPGHGLLPRENSFLYAGRISAEKGPHVAVEAFAGMPHHKLLVVGDGPEKEALQHRYANAANITFAGKLPREELLQTMKRAKAVIFPSVCYEGMPFSILEAFGTGTPVIASKLGSMEEMIRDGYNGFHFEAGNAGHLKNAIDAFEQAADSGMDLYSHARQTYLDLYHPDRHYQSIMSIYQKTIAAARKHA
jgi:glycosyltransferase involved in cell wall biosynthesis